MPTDAQDTHAPSRRIARNAAVRAGGEAIAKLASIAFFVVMARELGQDGFGEFMFALSLSTVLVLASGFGTEELVAREVARDRTRVHGYLANVAAVKAATSVVLLIVAAVIVNLGDWPAEARAAVYIVGAGVALENLGRTWHSVFTAYERLGMISISLVIQRTLTAGVGIAVLLAGGGVVAVSVVFAAGALIGLLIATQVLRRFVVAPKWEIDRSRWLPLVKAGVPIGLAALLFTILLRLDATLLGLLTGGEDNREVGVYAAAFRLVEGTLFVSWAFTASVLPWLSRQTVDANVARGYELGIKAITSVLMPIGLGFVLLASPLINLLYGSDYADAVLPLQFLGVMTVLYGLNSLASTVLITRDRPQDFTLDRGLRHGRERRAEPDHDSQVRRGRHRLQRRAFRGIAGGALNRSREPPLRPHQAAAGVRRTGRRWAGDGRGTASDRPSARTRRRRRDGLAYLASGLIFERLAFPADFARLRGLVRRRVGSPA